MQSLALIRRILEILGLCLKDSNNRMYGRVTNYVIFLLVTGFLMITFEYILTHFDDRANVLYAVMQFITFFTVWTCYICFASQKQFTFDFVTKLQEIVENYHRKHGTYGLYEEVERVSHGIAKWPSIVFFSAFYGVIIISVVDIIVSDLLPGGELHPANWYTFYKMSAPFNRGSVSGFIMYFIIQFFLLHCYYAGLFPSFSFFVGACLYMGGCCDDLVEQLDSIDEGASKSTVRQVQSQLTAIVTFHITLVEQFKLLTRIFSGIIFYQLACGSAFISTTLVQIDIAWGNFDGNFFVVICVLFLSIMCILPYCWYASVISLQLRKIAHDAYHSLWYKHPPYLQRYIRWIIIYGQIPRNFDGYNIFTCSLEVFMNIAKASGSYYLMLKSV